jgi:5-methylcytosine-specific restriction endonuclease McrA
MADAPEEPARRKRTKSTMCGEPGCDKFAMAGDRWQGRGYRCTAHGGGTQCTHVDTDSGRCPKVAVSIGVPGVRLCYVHSDGRAGAYARSMKKPKVDDDNSYHDPSRYEWIKRLKRDARLRRKHLLTVWARQDYQCADPMRACYQVKDGKATPRCPWVKLGEAPSLDQVQIDHIKPLSEGGSNDPSNLQAVCACCHAAKTAWEVSFPRRPAAAEPPECPPCV